MGSVGKIAVDFIVDDLKAEKIGDLSGNKIPHCVFINENNIVELPSIEIYKKKIKDKTLFLVSGDFQPLDEISCYKFCEELINICKKNNCKEIITLGGIGLNDIPINPKVFCTGNDQKLIERYCYDGVSKELNKLVGPIVGVSGVLVGLAGKNKIPGVTMLAETYAHPNYLGIGGAKELLKILNKRLSLGLNLKKLDKEIKKLNKNTVIKPVKKRKEETGILKDNVDDNLNYIG